MTTIFTPTDNELAAARAVVLAADPSESASSDGVAMVTRGGERHWVAWTPRVLATTAPVATNGDDAVVIVPRRLVEFGASLADELDDVEMLVDEDSVAVGNAESRISFDRLPHRTVPYVDADVDPAAQAVIDAHQLYRLFSMGATLPDGVDLGTVAAPEFQLSVGRGTVLGWVNWRVAGAAATRFQFAAETSGEAFTLVSPATISHVVQMTERHEQLTLWLPETADWVAIHASSWSAYVRCPVTDVDGTTATSSSSSCRSTAASSARAGCDLTASTGPASPTCGPTPSTPTSSCACSPRRAAGTGTSTSRSPWPSIRTSGWCSPCSMPSTSVSRPASRSSPALTSRHAVCSRHGTCAPSCSSAWPPMPTRWWPSVLRARSTSARPAVSRRAEPRTRPDPPTERDGRTTMTITYTINTMMLVDARDAALRQAHAQGYRHINVLQVRQIGQRQYEVDLLVSQ